MTNNVDTNKKVIERCYHCGRMLYMDTRTNRIDCKNTKRRGYLLGSKHLEETVLNQFVR